MLYDVIIIGIGPAGLTAGLYAARSGLKTLIIGALLGGTMTEAWKIENYPGFKEISGIELAKKMKEQVEALGVKIVDEEAVKIKPKIIPLRPDYDRGYGGMPREALAKRGKAQNSKLFKVITRPGRNYEASSLILALGTKRKQLNVPGEEKLQARGVSYCATCDAPFFKNKIVAVVGGGDSAVKAAMFLAQHAVKVFILVRSKELSGEPMNKENCLKNPKIEIIYGVSVTEIKGESRVEGVILDNKQELKLDGIFIEIGMTPASALMADLGATLDEKDFIKVDGEQKTNLSFVYAAGDVTTAFGNFKQILTAAAQGVIAATSAFKDLKK